MKILEIFGENQLEFLEKFKMIKISRIISIGQGKIRICPAKRCAFGPRMNKILKNFKQL